MAFAPRPHVELVHVLDMPGKDIQLPGANMPARLITLSESPVNKAVSAVLDLPPGWRRAPGANPDTFMEHYLLAGDLNVGGVQLLPHHYFRTEIGAAAGPWQTRHGARTLFFTEGDPLAWQAVADPGAELHEGLKWIDTNKVPWGEVFTTGTPVLGDGARLRIKLLHMDPRARAYTRLIEAMPGWHDHRLAHHTVVEEAYTVTGHMTYSYGVLEVDTYFYRPPLVKHGNFEAYPGGTVWLIRSDGELLNLYTDPDGTPLNWDPGSEREPVPADPSRSPRAGAWSGMGQHITPIPPRRPGMPDPQFRDQDVPST
jgi:hypothetical protein